MKNIKLKYQKYPEYKHSGVEWLGEIPKGWKKIKLKFIIKSKTGYAFPSSKFLLPENDGIPVVRISDIGLDGKVTLENCPKLPYKFYDYLKKYGVNKGDILFAMTGGTIGKVATYFSSEKALLNQRVCSFTILNRDLRKLVLFWMNSTFWKKHIELYASGGAQPNISDTDVLKLQITLPPLPEQTAIADFLDDKTAKIDRAIAQKEKLIALLKERKQIIIQNAVTKGLNPNVKLKDSGVEWIGDIPEHWEVKRLKYVFNAIQTGTTPSTSNKIFFNGEIDWYNPKDLNNEVLLNSEKKISKIAIKRNEIKYFEGDSVLIVGIGATTGKTSYMLNKGTFNQQITGFHSNTEFNKYYFYLLKTLSKVMLNVANYTTLPILNNEFFKSFLLVVPPLSEQKQIVAYIETQSAKIDKAISLQQNQIEKLKEYKTVLIDSSVTGKIKVS